MLAKVREKRAPQYILLAKDEFFVKVRWISLLAGMVFSTFMNDFTFAVKCMRGSCPREGSRRLTDGGNSARLRCEG